MHPPVKLHHSPVAAGVLVSSTLVPMLPRKRINILSNILLKGNRLEALIDSSSDSNLLDSQFRVPLVIPPVSNQHSLRVLRALVLYHLNPLTYHLYLLCIMT